MNWIERLFGRKETSGSVAKQRLQMVLIHDRSDLPPGLLEQIKDDIIAVIAHHTAIDTEKVEVHLEQDTTQNRLVAEIPLLATRGRRSPNGQRSTIPG